MTRWAASRSPAALLPASGFCARARAMASTRLKGVWAATGAARPKNATRRYVEAQDRISITRFKNSRNVTTPMAVGQWLRQNQAEHLQIDDHKSHHLPRDEGAEKGGPARRDRGHRSRGGRSQGAIRIESHGHSGIRLQPGLSWALFLVVGSQPLPKECGGGM